MQGPRYIEARNPECCQLWAEVEILRMRDIQAAIARQLGVKVLDG